uniref:Cystatin-2-like n=1 Tax=Geotrypetes seraphini TaxID=260995 RepID=A0A6P8QFH8_GEOSA|nr:cystatin-2-like [Geotrypetes seraphini]
MAALCPVFLLCAIALALAPFGRGTRLMPGGLNEASEDEEIVKKALRFAMKVYNRGSNEMYIMKAFKVIEAQKQIVSGINVYLTVEIHPTNCRKSARELTNCEFLQGSESEKVVICNFVVHSIPWLRRTNLTSNKCQRKDT